MPCRTLPLDFPLDLRLTLGPLRHGTGDPTMRLTSTSALRATRTPDGPATVEVRLRNGRADVEAWGRGAEWALHAAPDLLGLRDRPDELRAVHPAVRRAQRRLTGLRLGHSRRVVEALIPTILEQKVASERARRSYRRLVLFLRETAPGTKHVLLPPDPQRVADLPLHDFHRLDVERRRAETIRLACRKAARLEEAQTMMPREAAVRLTALPGIGEWTAAHVACKALGDPDALLVGDFHIPHIVSWVLAGEARGSDERMIELLEPYRGQRGRVVRLLVASGARAPSFGPRMRLHTIAHL